MRDGSWSHIQEKAYHEIPITPIVAVYLITTIYVCQMGIPSRRDFQIVLLLSSLLPATAPSQYT